MTRIILAAWVALAACLFPGTSHGDPDSRPTVGLVLSGGGAKGMAHVGVLKVLEEMRVPVDIVVGTSAGSAVGALYASGMTVSEMETRFVEMDWLSSFRDSPGREYRAIRRKRQDWRYPVSPGVGVDAGGVTYGRGLVAGQNLGFILNELTHDAALVRDFDQLPVRYRAVATDLESGEAVVLGEGSLPRAIRASMSIPGVYAPVEQNGRLLVDGGIANNLPANVARQLGAERIIAIDISDALAESEAMTGALSIVGQLTTIMTRRNMDAQVRQLSEDDVLIQPDLGGLTSADFFSVTTLIEAGATATRNRAVELNRLRVSPEQWRQYQQNRKSVRFRPGHITEIEIRHSSEISARFLRKRIRQPIGEPLDVGMLETDLQRIYGLGYYETVGYQMVPGEKGTRLVIDVQEKSWGPNYLRFGLGYADGLDHDSRFNVSTSLQMTELNRLGGEWQTGVQVGTDPRIRTQLFQPLDYGYRRFAVAGAEYDEDEYAIFDADGDRLAEIEIHQKQVDLAFGLELGTSSELRAEVFRGGAIIDNRVGEVLSGQRHVDAGGWSLAYTLDSLDDPFLPKKGRYLGVRGVFERPGLGSDQRYDRFVLLGAQAGTLAPYTGVIQAFASAVTDGQAGLEDQVALGGLRRLSAFRRGEITGQDAALVSLYGYRQFGGPLVPFYAGVGYETGEAWPDIGNADVDDLRHSGSVFLGLDTPVGPLQVTAAYSDSEHWTATLNLGYTMANLFRDF